MALIVTLICIVLVVGVRGTRVKDCHGGGLKENANISLTTCEKIPCKLIRGTTTAVELRFKPQSDIKDLRNNIYAIIVGIPFPFIGVDGTTACGQIFDAETGAKVACPLTGGKEYIYRNEFDILQIYPKLKLEVRWALKDGEKDEVCFKVPARITS